MTSPWAVLLSSSGIADAISSMTVPENGAGRSAGSQISAGESLGSIRFFVGEAVESSLSSGLRKPFFKQDGKLIHRGFPIKSSPHRLIEHIA